MEEINQAYADHGALDAKGALEGVRWMTGQAITTATVLSTAIVLLLGFAVENQEAGLLLIGAFTSLVLYIALRVALRGALPYLLAINDVDDGLVLLSIMDVAHVDNVDKIKGISDRQERKDALHQLESDLLRNSSLRIPFTLSLASIILQIVMVPVLVVGFNWSLF